MSAEYLDKLFGLNDHLAVVIGGAGVLGGALCQGLAQAGARVIVADLTDEACQARLGQLKELGLDATYCTVDVTSRDSIENS